MIKKVNIPERGYDVAVTISVHYRSTLSFCGVNRVLLTTCVKQ